MSNLFGTGINQIPTNGMLGNLAFQDKSYVSVDAIGIGTTFVDSGTVGQPLQVSGGAYVSGNLGIGTTNPTSKLWVNGDGKFTGVVTAIGFSGNASLTQLNVTGVSTLGITTATNLTAQQLNISGITTVGFLTATNISVSGVTTSNSYYIGTSQVISSARQLQNIASLDATTTATIETAIQQAPNTFNDLNITGISTLQSTTLIGGGSSTGTTSQNLQVTGGAYVSGFVGIGTTNPTQTLDVSGRLIIGSSGLDNALYIRRVTDNIVGVNLGYASTNSNSELRLAHNAGSGNFTIHLNGTGGEQGNAYNEKFRFTSAAQLGIGKSNPSAELDVFGGANFTNRVLIGSATSTGTANQNLQVAGSAYISGNLGIGTTNPFGSNIYNGLDVNRSNVKIFARNIGTTNDAAVWAADQDYFSTPSYKGVGILKYGTGTAGTIFSSIPYADTGILSFQNTTNALIYTNGQTPLIFATFSTERARFDGLTGNFGIGTTNPTSKLHVVGDTYISGILTATDINSASDIRLKTNIKPFENTLEKIVQINGVSFNWIDSNAKSGGIIAQDVEKVFPELVNDGDHKTVNYNGLIGVLIESIKELKQEVEDLKLRLNET
jgi:hypothetical protein